ncbi:hypothetical protein AC578_9824 [Pseudocercospora eumusae]|uniref:Uncharacterized protein n=1 Tax=Pseudocercospora eumusae TaxID=321146 RepID=A0A139H9P0_9PEZI|nr:hypothetical protein AC578_9824 [Pseudocercospora eumusae]
MFEYSRIADAPVESRSRAASASKGTEEKRLKARLKMGTAEKMTKMADTYAGESRDVTESEGVNHNEEDDVTQIGNIEDVGNNGNGYGGTTSADGGEDDESGEIQAGERPEGEDKDEGGNQEPLPASTSVGNQRC